MPGGRFRPLPLLPNALFVATAFACASTGTWNIVSSGAVDGPVLRLALHTLELCTLAFVPAIPTHIPPVAQSNSIGAPGAQL